MKKTLFSPRGWCLGLALAAAVVLPEPVSAQAPAPGPALRWGGDKSGGAPYIYEDKKGNLVGFEVDLAAYLGKQLNRPTEFLQGSWPKLLDQLRRGDIDLVLNGYEWSPEREKLASSTIPYYVYRIQLLARKGDDSLRSWDDLRAKPGRPKKRVGVLSDSAAERYVREHFGDEVDLKSYDSGVTDVMTLVQRNQDLDATVQDLPAAIFFGPDYTGLHRVGPPIAPGFYVMFVRKEDQALLGQLNQAIRKGIEDGTLRRIYEKYHLWNQDQEALRDLAASPWPSPHDQKILQELASRPWVSAEESGAMPGREEGTVWHYAWQLLQAAGVTVLLTFLAMPLAMALGLAVAVGRLYGPWLLRRLLEIYVEFLRGTPLLLQLYVIYFLLPEWGITLDRFWAGVLALGINYSAYEAENYRAGLLAIPHGQMEAALALGMSKWTALRRIIIPQAVRVVIPPVTNDFIALFKDTSICSVIAVQELTSRYNQLYNNHHDLVLQLGLMTALLYLLMSYPLSLVARRLERRFPRVVV